MLTLLLSTAIVGLSLMLLRHAFAQWRREHLNHRLLQRELPATARVGAP